MTIRLAVCCILTFLLFGCNKDSETVRWEGASEHWLVSMDTSALEEESVMVTFVSDSPETLFQKEDIISFAMGTTVGSAIYSYHQTDGYIRSNYPQEPEEVERIRRISEDTFEVQYDKELFETEGNVEEALIVVYADEEKIELKPVS